MNACKTWENDAVVAKVLTKILRTQELETRALRWISDFGGNIRPESQFYAAHVTRATSFRMAGNRLRAFIGLPTLNDPVVPVDHDDAGPCRVCGHDFPLCHCGEGVE